MNATAPRQTPSLPGNGRMGQASSRFRTMDERVRPSLRLLPLSLCIAMALPAHAADDQQDWGLCPIEDVVPPFPDAPSAPGLPGIRIQQPTDIEGDSEGQVKDDALALQRLMDGIYDSMAAGMPVIADPGLKLVRAVREAGLRVTAVPGASAPLTALALSGLPSDRFCFEGFLPAKASGRRERLTALAREPRTLVFYESSHRIEECLADLVAIFGPEREAVLARELTKLFETVLGDTLAELAERVAADDNQRKGEFVLVVRGCEDDGEARLIEGQRIYAKLAEHLKPSLAAKLSADLSGAPRKALYGGGE